MEDIDKLINEQADKYKDQFKEFLRHMKEEEKKERYRITVQLSKRMYDMLNRASKTFGLKRSELVRVAIWLLLTKP